MSLYIDIILEQNKIVEHIHNTLTVPCEKSQMGSFASSLMKNIVARTTQSKFLLERICCIAFRSASSTCCLRKSIAINYNSAWNNYSPANNQLCNHVPDSLQFFECHHIFSYYS